MKLIYVLSQLPHPQKEHLASRIRNFGEIKKYSTKAFSFYGVIIIETSAEKKKELHKLVFEYLTERHVQILNVSEIEQ